MKGAIGDPVAPGLSEVGDLVGDRYWMQCFTKLLHNHLVLFVNRKKFPGSKKIFHEIPGFPGLEKKIPDFPGFPYYGVIWIHPWWVLCIIRVTNNMWNKNCLFNLFYFSTQFIFNCLAQTIYIANFLIKYYANNLHTSFRAFFLLRIQWLVSIQNIRILIEKLKIFSSLAGKNI